MEAVVIYNLLLMICVARSFSLKLCAIAVTQRIAEVRKGSQRNLIILL